MLVLATCSYILVRKSLFSDLNTQLQVAVDATAMSAEHELNEHRTAALGEADLLGQAVMILLDNAVKFTPSEGSIGVGISRRGNYWVCHVSDTGVGIPEPAKTQIFDRFYRAAAHDSSGREISGSGLGLAIAKAIVDCHGGILTLTESRLGFTRFEIQLLASQPEDSYLSEQNQPNSPAVKI